MVGINKGGIMDVVITAISNKVVLAFSGGLDTSVMLKWIQDQYKAKEEDFIAYAKTKNCIGLKGHRSVGGFRASTYNACTMEDVQALVNAMKEFEAQNA